MHTLDSGAQQTLRRTLGLIATLRTALMALGAAGLGVFLGRGLLGHSRDLIVSVVATILYAIAILQSWVSGLALWVNTLPLIDLYIKIPMGAGIPDLSLNRFGALLFGLIF